MSNLLDKFTPEELDAIADNLEYCFRRRAGLACRDLARRLRQEEEENRRDPVTDPRPGDRIEFKSGESLVFFEDYDEDSGGCTSAGYWKTVSGKGATIIRRREVQP